jgi:hypothetical protein
VAFVGTLYVLFGRSSGYTTLIDGNCTRTFQDPRCETDSLIYAALTNFIDIDGCEVPYRNFMF